MRIDGVHIAQLVSIREGDPVFFGSAVVRSAGERACPRTKGTGFRQQVYLSNDLEHSVFGLVTYLLAREAGEGYADGCKTSTGSAAIG